MSFRALLLAVVVGAQALAGPASAAVWMCRMTQKTSVKPMCPNEHGRRSEGLHRADCCELQTSASQVPGIDRAPVTSSPSVELIAAPALAVPFEPVQLLVDPRAKLRVERAAGPPGSAPLYLTIRTLLI